MLDPNKRPFNPLDFRTPLGMDVISESSLIQRAATVTKRGGHAMGICNTHFMPNCMINQGGASGHQKDKTTERTMLGQLL